MCAACGRPRRAKPCRTSTANCTRSHACVRACVRASMRACVRACVRVGMPFACKAIAARARACLQWQALHMIQVCPRDRCVDSMALVIKLADVTSNRSPVRPVHHCSGGPTYITWAFPLASARPHHAFCASNANELSHVQLSPVSCGAGAKVGSTIQYGA